MNSLPAARPKTGKRMSLRKLSAQLAESGHLNGGGEAIPPQQHQDDARRVTMEI